MGFAPIPVWKLRASLGEGPVWDARDGCVYFVDIKGQFLHRYRLEDGATQSWAMAEPICWVIPRAKHPGFIAGFKSSFAELALEPLTITPFHTPEPERPRNRLNDAKADRFGRIWAGSMDDAETQISGALYRLDPNRACHRVDDGYAVANGPTFSRDGATLFHTDSGARTVFAFECGPDGALANKRPFITFDDPDWGAPDGMTMDAEGGLWIAHWGGARISRFDQHGRLDRSIALPASQITSCVFAGAGLDRMFVTSAAIGQADEPLAGALFEVDPGVCGAPAFAFQG